MASLTISWELDKWLTQEAERRNQPGRADMFAYLVTNYVPHKLSPDQLRRLALSEQHRLRYRTNTRLPISGAHAIRLDQLIAELPTHQRPRSLSVMATIILLEASAGQPVST